jgi:mannitol/fructose-specific phosphotransferase system IIA component (Ntr-type)
MAGPLAQLLDPARVNLNLQSTQRTAALYEVARLLDGHPDVTNFPGFYHELLARERIDATCLGNEIALPHARTEHVARIVMAVGRSDAGVYFENCNQLVRLFFVLGTPRTNAGDYLQVVGALCRIIKDSASRQALLQAPTAAEFIQILVNLEARGSGAGVVPGGGRP